MNKSSILGYDHLNIDYLKYLKYIRTITSLKRNIKFQFINKFKKINI